MELQDKKNIIQQVLEWIRENGSNSENKNDINENTPLLESGAFDSMQVLLLVIWLESEFNVTIGADKMTPELFFSPNTIALKVIELSEQMAL